MSGTGTLYGLSLGPGDPGLITRRAWTLLQRADAHWTYPVPGAESASFALSIALAAGLLPPAGSESLLFPMTHNEEQLAQAWLAAAQHVLTVLGRGTDVLFLVEGDASTYSSFGYLARTVRGLEPDIAVETVAGVASFSASAARLQMPLADAHECMAILPGGCGIAAIDRLLDEIDTLVLLKVKPLLDDILDLLERRGLLEHAAFIERTGTPEERIVRDLKRLRGTRVHYLSLLLVKNPQRGRGGRDQSLPAPGKQNP